MGRKTRTLPPSLPPLPPYLLRLLLSGLQQGRGRGDVDVVGLGLLPLETSGDVPTPEPEDMVSERRRKGRREGTRRSRKVKGGREGGREGGRRRTGGVSACSPPPSVVHGPSHCRRTPGGCKIGQLPISLSSLPPFPTSLPPFFAYLQELSKGPLPGLVAHLHQGRHHHIGAAALEGGRGGGREGGRAEGGMRFFGINGHGLTECGL